jgi:diaminopimelate epimerase
MPSVRLTKHHGLGNDFLVVFADELSSPVAWNLVARRWCDRRRGIGADGLLVARSSGGGGIDGPHVRMGLYNADGSGAEMSGNGIRCLTQAWSRRCGRSEGTLVVETSAGPRSVTFSPGRDPESIVVAVDMGPVTPVDAPAAWPSIQADSLRPVAHLDVGNPHTVVAVESVRDVDLAALGERLPDVNLEIIVPGPELHAITMRVHERGAGITEACGTGACAAAWSAAAWGMVPSTAEEIVVHMDGGDAKVRLDQPAPGRVTLIGPATFIATIEAEL